MERIDWIYQVLLLLCGELLVVDRIKGDGFVLRQVDGELFNVIGLDFLHSS